MNRELFPRVDRAPYTLPLDGDAFRRALRLGHGRAVLHARRHGIDTHVDDVVHACLHNLAYDPQCEGERAAWMLGLVAAAGAEALVVDRLLAEVGNPACDDNRYWHDEQRCNLLCLLANRGYAEARTRLYEVVGRRGDSANLLGGEEVLARYLERVAGPTAGQAAAGGQVPPQGPQPREGRTSAPPPVRRRTVDERTGADIIRSIAELPDNSDAAVRKSAGLMNWGRWAPEAELQAVADHLRGETNPGHLVGCLRVFQRRRAPVLDNALLGLVNHADGQVRWLAYWALSHFEQPEVRALALARLDHESVLEGALRLLQHSYRSGDHAAIEQAVFLPEAPDDVHRVVSDLVDLFEDRPLAEGRDLMLFVYEHSPCGNCRAAATAILARAQVMPDWLREEAALDAMEERCET